MPRYKKTGPGRPKTRTVTHTSVSQGYGNRPKKKVTIKSRGALRNTGKPRGWNLKKGEYAGDRGRSYAQSRREDIRRGQYHEEFKKAIKGSASQYKQFRNEWKEVQHPIWGTQIKKRKHRKT